MKRVSRALSPHPRGLAIPGKKGKGGGGMGAPGGGTVAERKLFLLEWRVVPAADAGPGVPGVFSPIVYILLNKSSSTSRSSLVIFLDE